jgi:hypothetical protein
MQVPVLRISAGDIDLHAGSPPAAPLTADYTKNKSTWSRVTEFLGLLGGLYTTCLGLGFTAWFLVDMMLPDGHGKFMV